MIALHESVSYQITTAGRVQVGGKLIEFVQERWVTLKLVDQTDDNLLFEYVLLDQQMEGSALIHQWAADMEWLQSPLYLLTDLQGKFVGMQGLASIRERWNKQYRAQLARKYAGTPGLNQLLTETDGLLNDGKRLIQTFMGYSHFRGLFQPLYQWNEGQETVELNIPKYFGKTDLPLILERQVNHQAEQVTIKNEGRLNIEAFDSKSFIRMLKELTNTYNLKVDLQLDLEEIYVLSNGRLETADLFLELYVPDFYQVTSAHQIKRILPSAMPSGILSGQENNQY